MFCHFLGEIRWVGCTTKATPLVQAGGGVELTRAPSVLRVRADCGGRLFTTPTNRTPLTGAVDPSVPDWT